MPSKEKQVVTHTFSGGMNQDVSLWTLPPDMYYEGLNIRIFQSGQEYIVTNPLGNIEIPFTLPAGDNYCLGSYGDTENNKFYWMNWNENGVHGVYMYNYTLNVVTPLLINLTDTNGINILAFQKRSLILMIDVIKGPNGNDLIYWCDGQVKQKKFNVQKALDKSATGYGMVITATDINAYKLAANAPVTNYFTDTTRDTNFVYGHLYKAAIRQWFDDGELNNWSEFSTVALAVNNGFTGNPAISNINNVLQITIETGPSIVKQLEIALKDGNNDFVSVVVLDKAKLGIADDSTYVYNFYNDNTSYSALDQAAVYRAYSFMPRLAALQAFCHNAMVYGKGIEGFPIVDVQLSSAVIYSDLFLASDVENEMNAPSFIGQLLAYDYTREGHGRRRNSLIKITVGFDVKAGNKFDLYGRNGQSDNLYFTYTATNADTAITVANAFKQLLVATNRIVTTSEDLPDTDIWTNDIDGSGNVSFEFIWKGVFVQNRTEFTGQVNPVSFQTLKDNGQSVLTQKSGDAVNYAVLYWNEDTYRSNAYTSPGAFVHNDFVTQTDGFKKIDHRISIHNQPPEWATHWELVRTAGLTYGSLPTDYIQILIQKAIESQSTVDTDYVDLIIGSLYTYQKMYPNTIVRYEFQKNDRVRLIKNENDDTYYPFIETVVLDFKEVGVTETINEDVTTDETATVTIGGATTADNIGRYIVIDGIERQIIAAPSGTTYTLDRAFGTTLKYPSFQIVDKRGIIRVRKPIGITIEDNSLIEVYKPIQNIATTQKNYFLFGQKYAIQNPGTAQRSHTGNIQNQDPNAPDATPAIVSITEGTTYVRNQQFPTNNSVPGTQVIVDLKESQSFSDFYDSNLNNNGKVAPEDDGSGEIRFGSRLRYSNNYIEGTRINGLNDFDNLDREDYNDPWGDFMLLKYRDRLLYAFKQLRAGYIGILNSIITTSDGIPSLATTTNFLNQYQTFSWEGGIGDNPESYASDQTWQYFLSPNSGTDCRIGGDGVLPTSQRFGLSQTIRDYIDLAQKYGSFIFGGFDRQNSERILAFEPYKPFVYRGPMTEAYWKLYDDPLPGGTTYQITTQPTNGEDSVPSSEVTVYTPDADFVGLDPSFFRWSLAGGGFSAPKRICLRVDEANIPAIPPTYYNAELTVNFYKEGCPSGYHGSTVPYNVPALKYSSFYTQEAADQQAIDEADVFGQTQANEEGECIANSPTSLAFTDLINRSKSTLTESNSDVIEGDYEIYPISIAGGQYQINGGAWISTPGFINDGDILKLRTTTASLWNDTVTVTITVGTLENEWTLMTTARVDDYSWEPDIADADINTLYESDVEPMTGFAGTLPVEIYFVSSVVDLEYRINGGTWTSDPDTIIDGDTIQLRGYSSPSYSTDLGAGLLIGDTSVSIWHIVTKAAPSVTINYSLTNQETSGDDISYVSSVLFYSLNGAEIFRSFSNLSSSVIVPAGSAVKFMQLSYAGFVWPKTIGGDWDGSATFIVNDGTSDIFDNTATEQIFELHGDEFEFVALEGKTYTVAATTESTSTRYNTEVMLVSNEAPTGDIYIEIIDNTDSEITHFQEAVTGSSGGYLFNILDDANLMTVQITNNYSGSINVIVDGEGAYNDSFIVTPTNTGNLTDVPKGGITVTIEFYP